MNSDVEMENANEGADPANDIKKQNPRQSAGHADDVAEDDPDKVQKLAKGNEAAVDPNAGQE